MSSKRQYFGDAADFIKPKYNAISFFKSDKNGILLKAFI